VADTLRIYQLMDGFDSQTEFFGMLGKTILMFGIFIVVFSIAKGLFMFFMRQTIIVMSRLIEFDLKNEIFEQYQHLSLAFYKRNKTGDLMNRISEDVSQVRMYLGPAIMYSINLVVLFVLVITTMLSVNATLTAYVLFPLPILSVTIYYVSSIINKKSERVQRQLSNLSNFVQEKFSGIRVIKAYNRGSLTEEQFEVECEKYKEISLELVKVNALFFPMMILLIGLSTILTIYIGGQLTIAGEITAGNIAEFVIYVNMLTWPVAAVGWVTSLIQRAAASQTRINEFLSEAPEITNPTKTTVDLNGPIEFENATFVYPDSGIKALDGINLVLEPGKTLGIIGRTGSGKSTLANLLCRLYDVSEGAIKINGHNLHDVNLSTLRQRVGYVPQEVFLFSDTVANNIAFGLEGSSEETIRAAARMADVENNIDAFPEQFETKVGERGVTLSGGQKQRISIARAIIKNPPILIFDDCLSAVDTETEEKILSNLKSMMQQRTTIIISHRVSSVKDSDKIIVMDDGKITERGNHAELIDQKGAYFNLYNQQLLEDKTVVENR